MGSLELFSVDSIIVLLYLIAMLAVGVKYGKSKENQTLKDYALAGKMFGMPVLFMTILATNYGSNSLVGTTAEIKSTGIIHALYIMTLSLESLIFAKYLSKNFDSRFDGMVSAGDMIEKYYGKSASVFSSFIYVIVGIGIAGLQMVAIGKTISYFSGISYNISIAIGGSVVTIYSAFGGMKAVTITDVIQFCILIAVIPIMTLVCVSNENAPSEILSSAASEFSSMSSHPNFSSYAISTLFCLIPISFFSPPLIQRYLMARSREHIRTALYINSAVVFVIPIMLSCIALGASSQFDVGDNNRIIMMVIDNLLPTIVKGFAITGVLAIVMSTIDSSLNTTSIIAVHNIMKQLLPRLIEEKKRGQTYNLYVRYYRSICNVVRNL